MKFAKLMHKYTRQKLAHRLLSCLIPFSKIYTRITCLASSDLNLYLPRYRTQKLQKISNIRE